MEINEEIIDMIENFKIIPTKVMETSNFYTDLGFDSLSFICFLLEIEEKYAISLDIMEMELCLQVDKLIVIVKNKVKDRSLI